MTSYTLKELGYFSKAECEKLRRKLSGKTYYNFQIGYGGYGEMNQVLTVSSENAVDTPEEAEELKNMFLNVALSELARR